MRHGPVKIGDIILAAVMVCAFLILSACEESGKTAAPPAAPKVVSKPIAQAELKSPKAVSVTSSPQDTKAKSAKNMPGQVAEKTPASPPGDDVTRGGAVLLPGVIPVTEDLVRRETAEAEKSGGTLALAGASLFQSTEKYDFKGRVDPFVPLLSEKTEEPAPEEDKSSEPKRILTPLEKMELSQIKLVAIIRTSKGPIAMVEEASGKGYEVGVGTYMGRNSGRVTAITPDGLVVTEYYKDYQGKRRERTQEVKFHKSEGGE